jgi:hypothetical protein
MRRIGGFMAVPKRRVKIREILADPRHRQEILVGAKEFILGVEKPARREGDEDNRDELAAQEGFA